MTEEIYKGHTIKVDNYLSYHSRYYQIFSPEGVLIVDTLWNDDKMWSTDEQAIASAKRCIDNPEDSYISLFNVQGR